eukprot:scaffold9458_cov126-Skeletonema_menzelii.AAC.1
MHSSYSSDSKRSVVLIALLALTAVIINNLPNVEKLQDHYNNGQQHINQQRRRRLNLLPSDPASISTKTNDNAIANADIQTSSSYGNADTTAVAAATSQTSSSSYNFAVLIISYHKTGHDLQEDLVKLLIDEFPPPLGPNITAKGVKSLVRRRMHTPVHLCSRLYLQPGTVAVQHAPDLFCSAEKLAKILLEEGDGRKNNNNNNIQPKDDLGVKIVHLIRNPFTMAVSNYHYHAKKPIPRPEMWITRQNPCQVTYPNGELFADYVLPSLSKRSYEALNINYDSRLILRSEFEAIANDCESLYQTRPGLEHANQFDHLLNLDAPDGLRLATAELTVQGHDNGGDMLRMSNNILKLKQAEKIVQNSWIGGHHKEFQVHTMSLDDFISDPKESALDFLNFIFDHNNEANDVISMEQKESAATKYSQTYLNKKEGSRHITDGKASNKEQLVEYLRHDAVFGPPLKKIEMLVETTLADSRDTTVML